MRRLTVAFVVLACLLVQAAGGCGPRSKEDEPPAAADSAPAPGQTPSTETGESPVTVQIKNYDEIQQLIQSYHGKVVVMDVWSTTCPPCIREFPGLVKLHNQYSRDDVICISLSLDYEGFDDSPPESYKEPVLEFLRSKNATFDNILAGESIDDMLTKLDIGAPPAVYVYDREGNLAKRFDNEEAESEEDEFSYDDIGELVAELVGP